MLGGQDTASSVQFVGRMRATTQTKWRAVLRAVLRIAVAIMTACSSAQGPASCKFQVMFAIRMACLPVIVEFLYLSTKHHDAQLIRFLTNFPGSVFPNMQKAIESGNLLYILWSPVTDKVYGGRTTCLIERHRQHFWRIANPDTPGQIPAYKVIRAITWSNVAPEASYFMLPVVQVPGGTPEAIAAERVFLNGYAFKLNMPLVQKFLRIIGVPLPHTTPCTVQVRRQGCNESLSKKPLPRRKSDFRTRQPLNMPKSRKPCNTYHRICWAMQFRGKDAVSKHGLRLLYVTRSRELIMAVVRFVTRNVSGARRNMALKHLRKRCKQLQIQMPLGLCTVRLPWCMHESNIPTTKSSLQNFILKLLWQDHFQASLLTHGRLKLRMRWTPTPSVLQLVRSAPRFNKAIDSESVCACICAHPRFDKFPKIRGHVCARQSELPWPDDLVHLKNLPAQTRIVPDERWLLTHVSQSLAELAAKIRDPFREQLPQYHIDELCESFSEVIVSDWLSGQFGSEIVQHAITVQPIRAIQSLCQGLFVDVLDKNPSAFCAICPWLVREAAANIFEYPTTDALQCNRAFALTEPVHTHACVGVMQTRFQVGDVVHVDPNSEDTCWFKGRTYPSLAFAGKLRAIGGGTFRYDAVGWLNTSGFEIPELCDELQPDVLNAKHAAISKEIRGQRPSDWTPVRVVHKHKDLLRVRPIGDQSVCPTALLFREVARCVELCVATLPVSCHFDRSSHLAVTQFLQHLRDDPLGNGQPLASLSGYALFVLSRDIENGFLNVLHSEVAASWDQMCSIMLSKGCVRAWVSPCKCKQQGSFQHLPHASWTQPKRGTWVKVDLTDVKHVLLFACKHMQIKFGGERGTQTRGITMGSSLGGALFRLVLVVHEMRTVLGPQPVEQVISRHIPGSKASCMRFMDDVRVFLVAPIVYAVQQMEDAALAFLKHTYPTHFPMKPDTVNPCVGLELILGRQLHWTAHVKGIACGYDNIPCLSTPFVSVQPLQRKRGIVMGAFARCKLLSSSMHWLVMSLANTCFKFIHEAVYPHDLISKWLKNWCVACFGKRGVQLHSDVLANVGRSGHETPAHRDSFRTDAVICPVGRIDWRCV